MRWKCEQYCQLRYQKRKRMSMQRLGEKMRTLRERRGLTMRGLAIALGYPASNSSYISDVEHGKRMPKADFLLKVADFFDVTLDQLARDELEV